MPELLDVHLELDPLSLADEPDPTRTVAELSRREAEARAAERNVRLRHPEPVEVVTRKALKPETAADVLLVATRWVCDGVG